MTTTTDRISLLVEVWGSEYTNTDLPVQDWRHSDGRPVTAAEAAQIALATLADFDEALRWLKMRTEIAVARSKDAQRLADLTKPYWNGNPDTLIGDALNVMTSAERAEADAILARLNGGARDYLEEADRQQSARVPMIGPYTAD